MTRELSTKASTALLRRAFADKGAKLSHTEALDILAKLKGYEAWSHLQQATAAIGCTPAAMPVLSSEPAKLSFAAVLEQHYGNQAFSGYIRTLWEQASPARSYWEHVATELLNQGEWCIEQFDVPAPVGVTLPNGHRAQWNFEQNLTDRTGELNYHAAVRKPGLALLATNSELLAVMRSQMCDELTFVCRKDGKLGLIFEVEYLSYESEKDHDEEANTYPTYADQVVVLCKALAQLQADYPQVQFCVPDAENICNDRPAIWGFFQPGNLTHNQRANLCNALTSL